MDPKNTVAKIKQMNRASVRAGLLAGLLADLQAHGHAPRVGDRVIRFSGRAMASEARVATVRVETPRVNEYDQTPKLFVTLEEVSGEYVGRAYKVFGYAWRLEKATAGYEGAIVPFDAAILQRQADERETRALRASLPEAVRGATLEQLRAIHAILHPAPATPPSYEDALAATV